MGVIIDDPEWAAEWARSIDEGIPRSTYEVAMNDRGSLRWTGVVNGEVSTLTKEPETGFWTRFKVNLLRVLPIDDQL
jgi:putative cardiolipin synthase